MSAVEFAHAFDGLARFYETLSKADPLDSTAPIVRRVQLIEVALLNMITKLDASKELFPEAHQVKQFEIV